MQMSTEQTAHVLILSGGSEVGALSGLLSRVSWEKMLKQDYTQETGSVSDPTSVERRSLHSDKDHH